MVERVLAWLTRFLRLRVRYEWREDVHLAFRLGVLAAQLASTQTMISFVRRSSYDIGGEFKNRARTMQKKAKYQAPFYNSPPISSDHGLPWSCAVVHLRRMTFQYEDEPFRLSS